MSSMKPWAWSIAVIGVAGAIAWACSPGVKPPTEICDNGVDDDNNGGVDCKDVNCFESPLCKDALDGGYDAGYFGACGRCGSSCSKQSECLASQNGTEGWLVTDPLPFCVDGGTALKCTSFNPPLRLRLEVDTQNWTGSSVVIRSMNVRVISKKAIDGSAVSCASVDALASGTSAQDADQIERSGKFNLLSWDTAAVSCSPGTKCTEPFLPIQTGSNYLVWVELWAGPRDGVTKLPTGLRLGKPACVESGAEVAEILPTDGYAADGGGTARTIRILMPTP
jgi:hypothetical protein